MEDSDNRVVMGALLVLTGLILGAGAALLVAPQAGEETRKDVVRLVRKARRRAEDAAAEFAENLSGMVDAMESRTEEFLSQGGELAKESKGILLDAIAEGEKRLARQRERIAGLQG